MNKGFTLIEMLVVVLIIGILASIALPQYQKAVQKSKFASLMTNASALYDAEEAFYLMNRQYTSNQEDLDIKVHDGNTGIYLSHSWNYVFAERPDLSNRLVMYLDHSRQFPGEIHCEAEKGNRLANELCSGGMGGRPVTGASGTSTKFKAYVLEGSGQGIPQGYDVNGDGVINGGDVSDVINGILGTGSDPEKDRDINGDGVVDDKDKQCIYDIILGNGLGSSCLSD